MAGTVEAILGPPETEGEARGQLAAESGTAAAAAAVLAGASMGPAAVLGMMAYGAVDLFGNVIPGIIKGNLPPSSPMLWPTTGEVISGGSADFRVAKYGAPSVITAGGTSTWDDPRLESTPRFTPSAAPPTPPPPTPPPPKEVDQMSWISTSLAALGNTIGSVGTGLVSGIDSFIQGVQPLTNIAAATAPLWGSAAPVAAGFLGNMQTGGAPPPAQQAAAPGGWVPTDEGEESYVPYQSTAQLAAWGLPGVDLMVPESQRIQPVQTAGRSRLPASHVVPYTSASGQTKYATYKNMGRPVLFSGDYAAARRVKKVASKARRYSGGR